MKALTIEEIMQIKTGDVVYIINLMFKNVKGYYKFINIIDNEIEFKGIDSKLTCNFATYGKTWVAYKNKEQADGKGELVELICKLDDTIYVPWIFDGVSGIAKIQVVFIEINKFNNKYVTNLGEITSLNSPKEWKYFQDMHHGVYSEKDFNNVWFTDLKLAEQKLKELSRGVL